MTVHSELALAGQLQLGLNQCYSLCNEDKEGLSMRLRVKVVIILASILVTVSFIIYLYSKLTLINEYEKIEKNLISADINRSQNAFAHMLLSLKILNTDWAIWDEPYQFMQDKNANFIKSNLVAASYESQGLNFVLFYDLEGQLFYGQYYDLIHKQFKAIPKSLLNYLHAHPTIVKQRSLAASKQGIIKLPEGYVVLSSMPIQKGNAEGPIRGSVVMGYFLDAAHIHSLSEAVEIPLDFFPLPNPHSTGLLATAYHYIENTGEYYIVPKNNYMAYGFDLMNDIEGYPVSLLRIEVPRTIYLEGRTTIRHYFLIMVLIGVIFLVAIWYLLKVFVLDRLLSVSGQVIRAKSESQFSTRIQISGNDELTDMVGAINSFMELIELSQEQLKYKITQHSEKLERLSGLNKNLFVEINRQKALEVKLKHDEEALRQMAYHDALTGLPNRVFFREFLKKVITKAEREGEGFSLLFLDLDKFKYINDSFGHDIGDKFLQHIATQLKNSVRKSDFIVRLSGDEFIVLLSDTNLKEYINIVVNGILKNISAPIEIGNNTIKSTVSIGVSIYPADGVTVEELEKHADLAMYYAKKQTGDACCYYDSLPKDAISPS